VRDVSTYVRLHGVLACAGLVVLFACAVYPCDFDVCVILLCVRSCFCMLHAQCLLCEFRDCAIYTRNPILDVRSCLYSCIMAVFGLPSTGFVFLHVRI